MKVMKGKWAQAAMVGLVCTAVGLVIALPARATTTVTTTRYGGSDRFATAQVISEAAFPSGAFNAIVARGEDYSDGAEGFADALSGTFLAGNLHAPILLTDGSDLSQSTIDALQTLKVKDVTVLGGTYAVSDTVVSELEALSSTNAAGGNLVVTRIAGADRYQTSQMVADQVGSSGVKSVGGLPTALIARGDDFPDALAGGPLAYASGLPLILTPTDSLSPYAQQALTSLGIKEALILGGDDAISTQTEASINELGITTQRLAGANRQQTADDIAEYAITTLSFSDATINLARGDQYPDALAGGPLAGVMGPSVIVLTVSPSSLGPDTTAWIQSRNNTIDQINVFGLQDAVSNATVTAAAGTATCQSTTTTTAASPIPGLGGLGGSTGTTLPACSAPPSYSSTSLGATTTTAASATTTTAATSPLSDL